MPVVKIKCVVNGLANMGLASGSQHLSICMWTPQMWGLWKMVITKSFLLTVSLSMN